MSNIEIREYISINLLFSLSFNELTQMEGNIMPLHWSAHPLHIICLVNYNSKDMTMTKLLFHNSWQAMHTPSHIICWDDMQSLSKDYAKMTNQ